MILVSVKGEYGTETGVQLPSNSINSNHTLQLSTACANLFEITSPRPKTNIIQYIFGLFNDLNTWKKVT